MPFRSNRCKRKWSIQSLAAIGLARVGFERGDASGCRETLAGIKTANPDFQSASAHILYARALEAASRNDEALRECESLSRYFGGEEPRVRRGLLPRKIGDHKTALEQFTEVRRSVERSPTFYRRNQQEWYRLAGQNMKPRPRLITPHGLCGPADDAGMRSNRYHCI